MNALEYLGFLLGIASVWLIVRRNIWAYPVGIVMVIIYVAIFYEAKFYSDMLLQVVYIVMQVQGWYEWTHSRREADNKITVRRFSRAQWNYSGGIQILGTFLLGFIMHRFTDAALPWVDAFTTTLSLIAQWQTNKRYLESWLLWIAADVIYLFQYSYKQLYLTTALYAIFLILAAKGYTEWKRWATPTQQDAGVIS